jgi:type III secretory pathway component EscT
MKELNVVRRPVLLDALLDAFLRSPITFSLTAPTYPTFSENNTRLSSKNFFHPIL